VKAPSFRADWRSLGSLAPGPTFPPCVARQHDTACTRIPRGDAQPRHCLRRILIRWHCAADKKQQGQSNQDGQTDVNSALRDMFRSIAPCSKTPFPRGGHSIFAPTRARPAACVLMWHHGNPMVYQRSSHMQQRQGDEKIGKNFMNFLQVACERLVSNPRRWDFDEPK
jgi:hypothetical protein